jgi:prepilin-type N-terminal cleavage/methylation domain-containing protein
MKKTDTRHHDKASNKRMAAGFTLVEILVAMVVGSIAMGAIGAIYVNVTQSYTLQRELAHMQQNMRAAMYLIKNDLRNSGRNGLMNGTKGITDVGLYNADSDDANGYPGITLTSFIDTDRDGQADSGSERTIIYRVWDTDGDGVRELRRQVTDNGAAGNWELVFDGIEDIGFAYAFDNDNDRDLDRATGAAGSVVMWGIDTDGTSTLDTNVDNNADGNIDGLDDGSGDGWINTSDGALGMRVPLTDIRAVRICLLARARPLDSKYIDTNTYTLGHKVIDMTLPENATRARFRHKMLVGAVALANHQWKP